MVSEDRCGGVLANEARDTLSSGSFAGKSGISDCPNNLNSEDLLHLSVSVNFLLSKRIFCFDVFRWFLSLDPYLISFFAGFSTDSWYFID